jgi:hypothetical protein
MDRATFDRETAVHCEVFERHRETIHRDCAGKYVVLTQGRLLAVTETFDEARSAVEQLQPLPEYILIFPAEMDPPFELAYDL